MKVLVAEDDPQLQAAYRLVLTKQGFETEIAADGQEALEVIKKFRPDLILLDIHMPNMNGLDFLRAYQQQEHHGAKVIAFSNMEIPDHVKQAYQLGASRYILKSSMSPAELVQTIRDILK